MFTTADKTNHSTTAVQQKAQQLPTFFRKAGEESFFGAKEQPAFFSAPVQAKLSVSSPDDPQEKEADAVADQVMRMPEPTVMAAANNEEGKVQAKPEAEIQAREEEEKETVQPKIEAPRISTISRMEDEGAVQTKLYAKLYRSADEGYGEPDKGTGTVGITSGYINCKNIGLYRSDTIQRSGRGPPTGQIPLEQSLASSKGGGSPLPSDTKQFMESRFNADFSGVRIHTDASARSMSSSIHAQAFAHGNDIYFNEGKYAPHTEAGGTLLAHELTHTIQQGASNTKGQTPNTVAPKIIARKSTLYRSAAGVPVQLTNAVTKAKTVEGKIDANKPGPDGNRTGWEHLVEIFKTTFGEDKVVSGAGGTSVKGAVAEQDIKKKRTATGAVVDTTSQTHRNAVPKSVMGKRDAMPSWCGIFVFWALNKSGVPMPKWKLGERMIKPEAARAPGVAPLPGDIAYRNAFSHYAIVDSVNGNTVTTVNGNTAGEDNLGGQVQTKDHPIADWTAFFNPLLVMQGNLGSGEGAVEEKPKSFKELRQELFNISRKTEEGPADDKAETIQRKETASEDNEQVQAKPELGSMAVGPGGGLTTYHANAAPNHTQIQTKPLVQAKQGADPQAGEEEQATEAASSEANPQTKLHASLDTGPPASANNDTTNQHTIQAKSTVGAPASEALQAKEEAPQEEKTGAAQINVQAKACCDDRANGQMEQATETGMTASVSLQAKTTESITNHSSLTNEGSGTIAAGEVQDRGPPVVVQRSSNTLQRGWFSDAIDAVGDAVSGAIDLVAEGLEAGKRWVMENARDLAMNIPGYLALRVILESDPITGEYVARNGRNFIQAAFDIMPGGRLLHQKLEELGALDEAAQWIDNRIADVASLVSGVVSRIENFIANLSLDSLASPSGVLEDAGSIIYEAIRDIIAFAENAATELLAIVKRWLLDQVVGFIQTHTTAYPLLCVIIGQDPIKETPVDRNGTNILSAILELGGEEGVQQRTQMQETGTFQKAAAYIDEGISVFGDLLATIKNNVGLIWSVVSIDALIHPIDTFTRIYETFAAPVKRVLDFMARVAIEILRLIKEVLMQRLSAWARTVRGFHLVTVLIGKDPFTNERVPRTIPNIIRGFMGLMEGGEEQYQQMVESGAIARTTQRIHAAVDKLNMTPMGIVQLFIDLWNSFSINDLANPIAAFQRIIDTFAEPIGRLIAFVVEIVKIVVVVILEIMNFPFATINNIITRTIAAFHSIKRNPIGFLKNLLRAIKQGFIQFFDNIVKHLINGVVGWLMSELRDAGIPELTDFSLQGVIGWVLQVLGLTMEKIWEKLAAHPRIGPERVARLRSMINTLEGIWTFIKDVQERGIAAIWEKIQEQLSNLWNLVLDAVKKWVIDTIITQVTVKLLGMLDPTGIMAVINSCIAIYKAIQSFIKYLREMLEILNAFVNGVADIAEGNVTTAANYLENTMGRAMPVVIGFLANQVGLGGVGKRIGEMIESVRELVDKALTWLVNKAVDTGMALLDGAMAMGRTAVAAGRRVVNAALAWARGVLGLQQPFTTQDGVGHRIYYSEEGNTVKLKLNPAPAGDYEVKMNEINPAAGATVTLTSAISVPLRRNGANVGAVNVPAGAVPMQDLKDAALQVARHIDGLIRSNMRTSTTTTTTGGTTTSVQDQTPDFGASLVGLSSITSHLLSASASGPLPVTPMPTYGGLVNGYASSMDVKPLTNLGVPGTNVGVTATNWENLNLRKHSPGPSGSFYYIRGHLLNNNVHGSGSTWQNLTPIQRSTNAQHVTNVESKVKEAVDKGLILHYNVTVDYAMPRKDNLIAQIEATPNWQMNSELNEKHKILEAEAQLPLRLNCTVSQIKADGTPLPTSDPTYDAKYNISGAPGVIDNAANVAQDSLAIYYLAGTTAVTYKDLPTLLTDAGLAIAADASITWDAFYGNAVNTLSIDNLSVTDRETLRNAFRKKDYINDERNRIEGQMTIVSWGAFAAGRVAYSSGLLTPADVQDLHNRFKNRMLSNKGFQMSALATYVNTSLTDPNTSWQSFKFVQQLTAKEYDGPDGNHHVILSEAEIQTFRTTVFDPRIAALRSAAAAAPPVAPATGPTTGTP